MGVIFLNGKKVYGRDKRLDYARVIINKDKVILDKYLINGILESMYCVKNDKRDNR
jgi:hypothetical protein